MRFASISSSRFLASSFAWLLFVVVLLLPWLVSAPAATPTTDKATHDGLRKLTAANFTLTNQGAWLIEFFSPNCVHCKKFGATWSELSQNKDSLRTQYPQAPFTLAQVDCMAQWDLCKQQGVQFLPRLTIYQDGTQFTDEYKGDRNYPEISAYIDKIAKQYRETKGLNHLPPAAAPTQVPPEPPTTPTTTADAVAISASAASSASHQPASSTAAVEAIAVEAIHQILPSAPNPKGELMSYGQSPVSTESQLKAWLDATSGQGATFVKFFAPWCPHCKAMAAAFQTLSESLKGRVNALQVDCEAHHHICAKYHIRGYPTLRLYDHGGVKEFNGGRNHDSMLKWVLKAVSSSRLRPATTSTELAALANENEVLFLYLYSAPTSAAEVKAVEKATKVLVGSSAPILSSNEPALLERYASSLAQHPTVEVPAQSGLLVFKDHSVAQPVSVFYPSTLGGKDAAGQVVYTDQATAKIRQFLSSQKFATVTELSAANFQETVQNSQDALVVLAAISDTLHGGEVVGMGAQAEALKDAEVAALRSVALQWRTDKAESVARQVVFAWIDADRWKSPLRKLYGIKTINVPTAVIVDGNRQEYYELTTTSDAAAVGAGAGEQWITAQATLDTISAAANGQLKPKSSRSLLHKSVRGAEKYSNALIEACVRHPVVAFAFVFSVLAALFFYLSSAKRPPTSALPVYSKVSTVKAD